jgi:hypothetical protein
MKKQNLPPFEELIERLHNSIVLRNPNKPSGQGLIDKLTEAWQGKDAELYKMVKQLEINEYKANVLNKKTDVRQLEFCTGVDVLGFPTYIQHIVKFENLTRDPKRYKKKGSEFAQKLVSAAQIEFKEGINLKIISAFKR